MDLFNEILIKEILTQNIINTADYLKTVKPSKVVKKACYAMLQEIKDILADGELDDFQCIEKIVRLFEKSGISCGTRHDF